MTRKILICLTALALLSGCDRKQEKAGHKPAPLATVGDRTDNGGLLRFTLEGKALHDRFVVAQFTPRGDLFVEDNLQIYNYDIESDKYPRILISISSLESDLKLWQEKVLPVELLAFSVSAESRPFSSRGEVKITRVTAQYVEGQFSGELFSEENGKSFPIQGEFKAVLRWNV